MAHDDLDDLQTILDDFESKNESEFEYIRVSVTYTLPYLLYPNTVPTTIDIYVNFFGVPPEMLERRERMRIIKEAITKQAHPNAVLVERPKVYKDEIISEEEFQEFYQRRRRRLEGPHKP